MSTNGVYDQISMPFNGVIFERAAERALKLMLDDYKVTAEPLENTTIHTQISGVPIVFKSLKAGDETMDPIDRAIAEGSYVMIMASGYQENDGAERCQLRVVVVTNFHNGAAAALELTHECWCAAVRGIFSGSAVVALAERCNALQDQIHLKGWHSDDQPSSDEWTGSAWVHEQTFTLHGALLDTSA